MKDIKLAIIICATKSYCYAMSVQARRLQAAFSYANIHNPYIILVTDKSGCLKNVAKLYEQILPKSEIFVFEMDIDDGFKNYKTGAQLTIAQMRTAGFSKARELQVDYTYSLDSDVLPAINSIQCALDVLNFDKGYYSIACPLYSTQGGPGSFLCGHGTPERPILPDFSEDERLIPKRYLKFKTKYQKEIIKIKPKNKEEADVYHKMMRKLMWVDKRIEKYPPKADIFSLNGKGKWKRRGWFDFAYPAIGKGSVVPSDWCGFGATMMNRKALELAVFDGYDGRGTEDLFVCFHRWYPAGLKIGAIPHSICDHVIRDRNKNSTTKYLHIQAYHQENGEFKDHLRQRVRPFFTMEEGEKFEVDKTGNVVELKPRTSKVS